MSMDIEPSKTVAGQRCLACGGTNLEFVSRTRVAELAKGWARDRAFKESPDRPAAPERIQELEEEWSERIRSAIDRDVVVFRRCSNCGLQASEPARCWPEGAYTEDECYPRRWEFGQFLDDLGPKPCRILELGAGQGTFLQLAREREHTVVGIDFNPAAVAKGRSLGLSIVEGGFDKLREHLSSDHDPYFDAVAMFHVIEHLPDPEAVLKRLSDFVRPGTRLGISCPGPRRFTKLIDVQQVDGADYWDFPPHHVLRWTSPALQTLLERLGWKVDKTLEEPLRKTAAASQMGVTRAQFRGFHHRRQRRRWEIALARMKLAVPMISKNLRGLSLYVVATRIPG